MFSFAGMSLRKNTGVRKQNLNNDDFIKDERPTSNIERSMTNENKSPIPNCFFFSVFSNSKFDVGRSMFDVHSSSSIKTI
jgi:hypothetical protein